MKRSTLIVVSLLVIASLVLAGCGSTKGEKVTIATNAEFAPFEYVDETSKEMVGFDIDLIKAVAEKANIEIEIQNTGFDAMLAGVSQCQYDAAIAAITITEDRQKEMTFSDPYINAGQVVVIKIGNEEITGKDSLIGKTVGAQIGTTGAEEVKNLGDVTLKTYDTYEFAMLDLINGQIDAVVVDYPTALGFIGKNSDKIQTIGDVFTNESYGIAVCNTNKDLLAKLNAGLKAAIEDGTVASLEQKWLAGK